MKYKIFIPLILAVLGIALRLGVALPAVCTGSTGRFFRPDSDFYMLAATDLANNKPYPGTVRAPGFPAAAAIVLKVSPCPAAIAIFFALAGGAASLLIYAAGKSYSNEKTGCIAQALYVFNPTSIFNAPMFLADTLLGILLALQFWLFVLFWKKQKPLFFLLSVITAAIGALVKPINMFWILPAVFLLAISSGIKWKSKLIHGLAAFVLFCAVLFPWMYRNYSLNAGFCIDTNTGAMLHQNGAMLTAEAKDSDFELEKQKILADLELRFADAERFPDEKSRVSYRKQQYIKLICAHPLLWLKQQFQWKILLPDVPTGFELLGVTSPGRGTMGILARDGVWAAANHYFDGKLYLPLLFLPLLLIVLITYAGCLIKLMHDCIHLKSLYFELFVFLAFAEYYFFLPGAITAPRYQIPALPVLCVLAAAGILLFSKDKPAKKSGGKK